MTAAPNNRNHRLPPPLMTPSNGSLTMLERYISKADNALTFEGTHEHCYGPHTSSAPAFLPLDGSQAYSLRHAESINWKDTSDLRYVSKHPVLCELSSAWISFLPSSQTSPGLYTPFRRILEQVTNKETPSETATDALRHYMLLHWLARSVSNYVIAQNVKDPILPSRPFIDHTECIIAIDKLRGCDSTSTEHWESLLALVLGNYLRLLGWVNCVWSLVATDETRTAALYSILQDTLDQNQVVSSAGSTIHGELLRLWTRNDNSRRAMRRTCVGAVFCAETPQFVADRLLSLDIKCRDVFLKSPQGSYHQEHFSPDRHSFNNSLESYSPAQPQAPCPLPQHLQLSP